MILPRQFALDAEGKLMHVRIGRAGGFGVREPLPDEGAESGRGSRRRMRPVGKGLVMVSKGVRPESCVVTIGVDWLKPAVWPAVGRGKVEDRPNRRAGRSWG